MNLDETLLLMTLARIVQARLEGPTSRATDHADLEMLNRVLKPFDPPERDEDEMLAAFENKKG